MNSLLTSTVILLVSIKCAYSYSCVNDDGRPVDWVIAIKVPSGGRYIHMDSNSPNWKYSDYKINEKKGFFYNTLKEVYANLKDTESLHVMYNDDPPTEKSKTEYGHMKGVVSFKRNGKGFWLVHSAPKTPGKYAFQYKSNGFRFGQSFFCATFDYKVLKQITEQLLIGRPQVYQCKLSPNIVKDFPRVKKLSDPPSTQTKSNIASLTENIIHFSKGKQFNDDLYSGLVAPGLKQSLYVEAWRRKTPLPNNCTQTYRVFNIKELKVSMADKTFKNSMDHSKWAVTEDRTHVCIGDLNRANSQSNRGGGTLCLKNSMAAQNFYKLIQDYEKCKNHSWWYNLFHYDYNRL